jgi:hypothetical protein
MSDRPKNIVKRWKLWGPNSGGGESVLFADGRIWNYAYGDAARGEGESYYSVSLERYFKRHRYQHSGRSKEITTWLRENGHAPA